MTSNQTSSWQTESRQRDSLSHKGKEGKNTDNAARYWGGQKASPAPH